MRWIVGCLLFEGKFLLASYPFYAAWIWLKERRETRRRQAQGIGSAHWARQAARNALRKSPARRARGWCYGPGPVTECAGESNHRHRFLKCGELGFFAVRICIFRDHFLYLWDQHELDA